VLPRYQTGQKDQAYVLTSLSGYTAKLPGTERGITEPVATFSACFGEAFPTTFTPTAYANLPPGRERN